MTGQVPIARFLASALLAAILGGPMARAQTDGGPVLVALARWQAKAGRVQLIVPLADALTPKQKSIITGGFTTVSQLTLRQPTAGAEDADGEDMPLVYGVRCSVKFDAWEETYDVARLDDSPKTALVKDFATYGDLCLKAELSDPAKLGDLARTGGTMLAFLVVKQTSVEEASRIKEWLIQQQSGVMQSLFSHMLGELTLNQTVRVKVSIPPKPETVEEISKGPKKPAAGTPLDAPKAPKPKRTSENGKAK